MRKLSSGEEKVGPEILSSQAFQSLLDYFLPPLSPFQVGSSGSSQRAVYLPPYNEQVSVPLLAQITSTAEQISLGSPAINWRPPLSGHKIQFVGVERDLLSRAPCPKNADLLFFFYLEASSQHCVAVCLGFLMLDSSAEQLGWSHAALAMHIRSLVLQPPAPGCWPPTTAPRSHHSGRS